MNYQRRHKVDFNQQEIVEGLRKAGRTVVILNSTIDLLVGYQGKNFLLEVKRPEVRGKKTELKESQKDFIRNWRGQVSVVYTIEEALNLTK
jgi:hypothetical protein